MKFILCFVLSACSFATAKACHSSIHDRKKRQVGGFESNMLQAEAEVSILLRDFFTECLESNVGPIWTWESVVDLSVLDTQWYQNTDSIICRGNGLSDNAECWKNRLNDYLLADSFLQGQVRICIDEYAAVFPDGLRRKRQTFPFDRQCSNDFFPNDPTVRQYGACNQDRVNLITIRRPIDFPSVTQFIADNTICSSELSDCDVNQMETISENDRTVPDWPYRFEAITRQDSPVRASVFTCNNLLYPVLQDNEDDFRCSQWGEFEACSVTCGRGQRVRTRMCPTGFSGETSQMSGCESRPCISFQNILIFYILNLFPDNATNGDRNISDAQKYK